MAHKTLIGGTAYEIGGGKTLVGGTAYSIDKGKTLVGGTAYEVGFGGDMATVRLMSDTFENDHAGAYISYVNPDGDSVFINTAGEYKIPIGTIICFELKSFSIDRLSLAIHLNDEQILLHFNEVYYEYTLTGDIIVELVNNYDIGGSIYITEL